MYLVGNHELFERRMLLLKTVRQFDRLIKGHIAIVVSMDQQHGRFPLRDVRIRRGSEAVSIACFHSALASYQCSGRA